MKRKKSVRILHYGLQRSGTNFLETLLKKNYQVRFLNNKEDRRSPLQKHCRLYKNKNIIPHPKFSNEIILDTFDQFESLLNVIPDYYLIISKDPYSWYISYLNWAKKCNWPKVSHHYIEEYNLFYKTFMEFSFQSNKFIFIRYLDLIQNTNEFLDDLEKNIILRKKIFSKLKLYNPTKISHSSIFTEDKKSYYINEEYLKYYKAENLQILNTLLDPKLISFLGYELRDSVS